MAHELQSITSRKCGFSTGNPDASPNTESMLHLGQRAVAAAGSSFVSVHSLIDSFGNRARQ